ncbi:hypothetical protein [Streptomyces sp. NPDC094466]|uniref:hypothetical protein n=1 Tax=Streptomyces sp. NPDC094466 TaxID=3366065 RepID=UPI0038249F6E
MTLRISGARRCAVRVLLAATVVLGALAPTAVTALPAHAAASPQAAAGVVAAAPNPRAYVLHGWPSTIRVYDV